MFLYDRGLFLQGSRLAIDVTRRQPCGFISHAHFDHMARHETALCTPATRRLFEYRMPGRRRIVELPYREPRDWGDVRLTTFPAGHVLGSAALLVESGRGRMLYTGDFKLSPSATADPAELPQAETLIVESTYGDPRYRLPPREESIAHLLSIVRRALCAGATPVVRAYVLGKAQEVSRILGDHGIPVQQHPLVYGVSRVYEQCGVPVGRIRPYDGRPLPGHAVIVPPRSQRRAKPLEGIVRRITVAVTGWSHCTTPRRLGVDFAVPLSDHADYDELLDAVESVNPQTIYCTHGPQRFVEDLKRRGHDARPLERQAG